MTDRVHTQCMFGAISPTISYPFVQHALSGAIKIAEWWEHDRNECMYVWKGVGQCCPFPRLVFHASYYKSTPETREPVNYFKSSIDMQLFKGRLSCCKCWTQALNKPSSPPPPCAQTQTTFRANTRFHRERKPGCWKFMFQFSQVIPSCGI